MQANCPPAILNCPHCAHELFGPDPSITDRSPTSCSSPRPCQSAPDSVALENTRLKYHCRTPINRHVHHDRTLSTASARRQRALQHRSEVWFAERYLSSIACCKFHQHPQRLVAPVAPLCAQNPATTPSLSSTLIRSTYADHQTIYYHQTVCPGSSPNPNPNCCRRIVFIAC